jgi:hypothetical protein
VPSPPGGKSARPCGSPGAPMPVPTPTKDVRVPTASPVPSR